MLVDLQDANSPSLNKVGQEKHAMLLSNRR
jgi:hypothetical protein